MSIERAATTKPVELHIDTRVIDHPLVPVRWCLSKETTEFMRKNPQHDWALIVVVQQRGYRDEDAGVTRPGDMRLETRMVIEGFRAISIGHGFLQLRAPGDYTVVTHLVHTTNVDARSGDRSDFWKRVRSYGAKNRDGCYTELIDLQDLPWKYRLENYATDTLTLVVPDGIFAKEMKPWVRKHLDKMGVGVGPDECAGRWRLFVAFTILPVLLGLLWLFAYVLTRAWLLLLGVLHLLVGGSPLPAWKAMGGFDMPSGSFWMNDEFERLPVFKGVGALFIPFPLLVIGLIVFMIWSNGAQVIAASILMVAVVAYGLLVWSTANEDKIEEQLKKSQVTRRDQSALSGVALIERYAICEADPPKGPRTVELFWSGLKRSVCKPRAIR